MSFVLFHTHPSGDPTPSGDDLTVTWLLAEAASAHGIRFLDHFVLGSRGRWVSLRTRPDSVLLSNSKPGLVHVQRKLERIC